jgi:hypothetical protein
LARAGAGTVAPSKPTESATASNLCFKGISFFF